MDPLTIGSLAAGALGSIFGGSKPRNPFRNDISRQSATLQGIGNNYGQQATAAQNNYDIYSPKKYDAINAYGDYLEKDPYTDSYSTRALAGATAGTGAAYDSARSNLAADMSRRGITGGSTDEGGMAAIEGGRAANYAAAQNALASAKIATRGSNLQQRAALYSGVADDERSAENQALNGQAGIASNLLSSFTGLNADANQQAQAEDAQNLQGISGAGGLLGSLLAGGTKYTPFTPGIAGGAGISNPTGNGTSASDIVNQMIQLGIFKI